MTYIQCLYKKIQIKYIYYFHYLSKIFLILRDFTKIYVGFLKIKEKVIF